jgi:hypothetical protein
LLKSPDDLIDLEALAAYYPDAMFVMTHRDPLKVVPSACSVTATHTQQRLPDWQPDQDYGRRLLDEFADAVDRFMASRAVIGEERFVDVGQPELNADPLGIAERVFDFAGLELGDDVKRDMATWSEEHRSGSGGEHRYSAEEFGLTDDMIRERFATYIDRYGEFCLPR